LPSLLLWLSAHAAVLPGEVLLREGDVHPAFGSGVFYLLAPGATADGTPFFGGSLYDGTAFLLVGTTPVWVDTSGTAAPDAFDVWDEDTWAGAVWQDATAHLVSADGVLLSTGDPAPGLPIGSRIYGFGQVSVAEDGVVFFYAVVETDDPLRPVINALYRAVDGHVGLLWHTTGMLGTEPITWLHDVWSVPSGGARLGFLATAGSPGVVVDGELVVAAGDDAGVGGTWSISFSDVALDNRGTWLAAGYVGIPYTPAALATPLGTVVLGGTTLDGVPLDVYDEVGALGLSERGVAAMLWTDDLIGDNATVFVACDVRDVPGTMRAVLSTGDALDTNGDGTGDVYVVGIRSSYAREHDLITEDGDVLLLAEVSDTPYTLYSDEAVIRVDGGCTCAAPGVDLSSAVGAGVATGNTCGAGNDEPSAPGSCPAAGHDLTWAWTAPATGTYTFRLQGSSGFAPSLRLITETCAPAELTCTPATSGIATQARGLRKGERVRIVADAPASCGAVTLSIQGCPGDHDTDGVCDPDLCIGDDATGDSDGDGVCGDLDLCVGDDATWDDDGDQRCGDLDLCWGDDRTGNLDADGVCDDLDACWGPDASGDSDGDGFCDAADLCVGDDLWGDSDGDGLCDDTDFLLDASRVQRGATLTLRVHHAPPGATVRWYATLAGHGGEPCLGAVCGGLVAPLTLATRTAQATGFAEAVLTVPATLPVGRTVLLQASWSIGGDADMTEVVTRVSRGP
jgi:hypothetical protein